MEAENVVSLSERPKSPTQWHKYWQKEHDAAEKRLRSFRKQGNEVNKCFLDDRKSENTSDSNGSSRLNLFHTNISTMQSMLYGSTPRIDVSREHHDPDDDVARVASVLFKRMLQADIDPSGEDTPTVLKSSLQDRLLPGLGVARVRYSMTEENGQVADEQASLDYVHWQDNLWGWGRTWKEIPWWGYRSWLEKWEVEERFGEEVAKTLEYVSQLPTGGDKSDNYDRDQKNNTQKAEIWEFWHREQKKVFWWSASADIILDAQDDPLKLDGFLPMPKPLTANVTTTLFEPRADYIIAQDLYREIDVLQSRITCITRAVKVVGVYDQSSEGVKRMMEEGCENELIPVENWAMFSEKGGLDGQIDWFPVQEVAQTLTTLRGLLGETIELLYQVTGMSDVLRGANTDQYQSDGTNQLKAKFGSIRIQALQDEFARFASDLEALKAEVISKHFSPEAIMRQSNAQFMPEADRDKILPAIELMRSQAVKWRIDIRPESIAMVDYAQLKSERVEYLTAMATYMQSASTMVKEIPESMPILLEFMKFGLAGFKGSDYMEGMLDQAIDLAKKAPPKQDDKGAADQAKMQGEMQKIQAKSQADLQLIQAKGQQEMQKMQSDHQANMAEIQAKGQADNQKIMTDLQADLKVIAAKLNSDLQVEEVQSTMAIAEEQVQHSNTLTEEQQQHLHNMSEQNKQGE